MVNYYATLGVLPTASPEEIKASFRQLAKRFHPDVRGGNPLIFAKLREAYNVLSEPGQRNLFDEEWRRMTLRTTRIRRKRGVLRQHPPEADVPIPMLTRIMSIAMPRESRFVLEGILGSIQVEPTLPDTLWETTMRKFQGQNPERLARHVVQIRLHGERALVASMLPKPTEFGVRFQQNGKKGFQASIWKQMLARSRGIFSFGSIFGGQAFTEYGSFLPLSLQMTVPRGTALFLKGVTGTVSLGDLEGDLVGKLLGGALRAGKLRKAHLTLNGNSKAFLAAMNGPADLLAFGESQLVLQGSLPRIWAVLENNSQLEVRAPVQKLRADVNGKARLHISDPVGEASCQVRDSGYVYLGGLRNPLRGLCLDKGQIEIGQRLSRIQPLGHPAA